MYLKSLVLKGFKSFADRSVLAVEPGITAIVGPNGSGKSNISDAVLWVLGERSARNLRGQAMEDIIFSGSAARKPVSVAEVELVLDNTDGTLPIDYDEVSIMRRMYRSGESEYLVNGTVARRIDVLDILHDSGLGTGTHSIISQGNLDSILQSRPEDRRAIIEEAAGVLKHKQRKEKSERKLSSMENHLARVRDVAAEVSRQLGPLERKAKRAEAYKVASEELARIRLELAVDDLRKLQGEWDAACKLEIACTNDLEDKRKAVDAAEKTVAELQEIMRRETADASELLKQQRRCSTLAERLDGADMLARERRRSNLGAQADLRMALDGSDESRNEARRELEKAKRQLEDVATAYETAETRVKSLTKQRDEAHRKRRDSERELEQLEADIKKCDREIESAKRERSSLQESLSNGLAHEKVVQARREELSAELDRARDDQATSSEALRAARAQLEDISNNEEKARNQLVELFGALEQAKHKRDEAHERTHVLEAEAKAIEKALRASMDDDPALTWLLDNASLFESPVSALSLAIKAPEGVDALVENILGDDLRAVTVDDIAHARAIASEITDRQLAGGVSIVPRSQVSAADMPSTVQGKARLVDELDCADEDRAMIEALLGDIVLCDTNEEMFDLREAEGGRMRYASRQGCMVQLDGRVKVFGRPEGVDEGVLARQRRLDSIRLQLESAFQELASSEDNLALCDQTYRDGQAESLKLSQMLANQKGVVSAAESDDSRAKRRVETILSEMEDIERQAKAARKTVNELRPDVEAKTALIAQLEEKLAKDEAQREQKATEIDPIRREAGRLNGEFNDAKLQAATLAERKTYSQRMVTARESDIEKIDATKAASIRGLAQKRVVIQRSDELLECIGLLAESLQRQCRVLEDALNASEDATGSVNASAARARGEARKSHDDFDEANARMTQVKVDKSRLEVQVEAAVRKVVEDCATPLDKVDAIELSGDRQELEDEVFRIERRIKNMGTINPDAANQYAELKERYDFLAGQLSDMEAARQSLNRITRVIDARMKDDFARTFETVNANFAEVFSLLFPGGTACLQLEDPDDIENTGVEVKAQPRGKRLTKMSLMSGGEKSLTALALLFAVYKTRSTPFYILDEVEAALDDTNLRRLASYIDSLRQDTQLIMITHQRRTMEMADVLFGVSMQADGVTKVISQKLERALEQAE